jgi:hypothetical protein
MLLPDGPTPQIALWRAHWTRAQAAAKRDARVTVSFLVLWEIKSMRVLRLALAIAIAGPLMSCGQGPQGPMGYEGRPALQARKAIPGRLALRSAFGCLVQNVTKPTARSNAVRTRCSWLLIAARNETPQSSRPSDPQPAAPKSPPIALLLQRA